MLRQGVVGQYGPEISLKGKQKDQREDSPCVDYFDTNRIFSDSTKKAQKGIEPNEHQIQNSVIILPLAAMPQQRR